MGAVAGAYSPDSNPPLLDFQDHYERIAQPFDWKFTGDDLDALLAKIQQQTPSTAQAA